VQRRGSFLRIVVMRALAPHTWQANIVCGLDARPLVQQEDGHFNVSSDGSIMQRRPLVLGKDETRAAK